MSDTSTKYLVYASLLLGSIGTYNAVKEMTSPKDTAIPGTSSFGGISASELNGVISQLDDLTIDSQAIAERLLGLETWRTSKVNASRSVTVNSSPAEISQSIMDRLTDVESLGDSNDVNIATLRNDVNLNTDDVSAFSVNLQEQISTNKAAISAVDLKVDITDDNIANILTPRLDDIEADITLLGGEDTNMKSRIKALEEAEPLATAARDLIGTDLVSVAQRVTNNETAVTDLEDDIELMNDVDGSIAANKANITALVEDAGFLAEKFLRSGDDILCNGLLRANHGAEIALNGNYLRMFQGSNNKYMMYATGSAHKSPTGKELALGNGFAKVATRVRVPDSAIAGLIVENSSEEMLLSVRGSDGLTACAGPMVVDGNAYISSDTAYAYFSHGDWKEAENYALSQHNNGMAVLNSPEEVRIRLKEIDMVKVTDGKTTFEGDLYVNHASGTQDTVFRTNNNYISTGANNKTHFRFGTAAPSVIIRDKEVNINGTDVLAKLNSLQAEVNNCVKNQSEVNLKNVETKKFIYADNDSSSTCEARGDHSYSTRCRFTVNLR